MEKGLIFTYGMTYGGAAASLINPYLGLLIYVCFAIIKPESMWHWSVPEGNYSRIVAIGLLSGWAIHGFGKWQLGRSTIVVGSLVGLLLWGALSALQSNDVSEGMIFVEQMLKIVLPFLVGITTIDSVHRLKTLAWVILLSQGFVAFELNVSYYQGFNRVHEMGFGGMDNNSVAIAMVTCTGFAFFLGVHAEQWWAKVLCLTIALLLAHVVLFAFSRGGMLALIVTALTLFFLIPKKPKHYILFTLIVLTGLRLAGPEVRERFLSSFTEEQQRDFSAQSRLDLWADMWDCTLRHPAFGVGPRQWGKVAAEYGWPPGKEGHSLWIQTLVELGFPGLIWLLLFYGSSVIRLYRMGRNPETVHDPWLCFLAQAVVAAIIGFSVAAQFVSLIGLELPYYIALVGAGVLKLASFPPEPNIDPVSDGSSFECFVEPSQELEHISLGLRP